MSENNAIKARLDAMLGGETQDLSEKAPFQSNANQSNTKNKETDSPSTFDGATQDVSDYNPAREELFTKEAISDTISLLVPGKVIGGHYRIIRRLGAGGMGTVFKAEDVTLNNKIFAIKVLNPELSCDDKAIESLKKEALSAMELHHTNIMTVNAFEGLSNIKFLVMEFLDGPDLEHTVEEKGKLSVDETMEVARQVCPALDFAHSRNIIHRDIKPANMVYKSEAGTRVVKIADLGIAFSEADIGKDGKVQAVGTLFYMAPELFDGTPPTPQSDQYALACTFYEFLAGSPPITGTSVKEVIKKVREIEASPIDGISIDLNKALLRALSKDRTLRFANCSILLEEMEKATTLKGVACAASARQEAELKHFLNSHSFEDPQTEEEESEDADYGFPEKSVSDKFQRSYNPVAYSQPQEVYAKVPHQQPQEVYEQPAHPQIQQAVKAEFTSRSQAKMRPKMHSEPGFDQGEPKKHYDSHPQPQPDYAAQRMERLDANIANAKKTVMMGLIVGGLIIVLLIALVFI